MITISTLKKYYFLSARQFQRFFAVGFSSMLLDIFSLILLKEIWRLNPVGAVAINQLLVISFNFVLNKYWSFSTKKRPLRQLSRYLAVVILNYLLALLLMYLFNQLLAFNYILVRLGSIALLFTMNFILYQKWVYKEK